MVEHAQGEHQRQQQQGTQPSSSGEGEKTITQISLSQPAPLAEDTSGDESSSSSSAHARRSTDDQSERKLGASIPGKLKVLSSHARTAEGPPTPHPVALSPSAAAAAQAERKAFAGATSERAASTLGVPSVLQPSRVSDTQQILRQNLREKILAKK